MSNLTLRIISAAVLIPPVIALTFYAPHWLFTSCLALVAGLAGFEHGTITSGSKRSAAPAITAALAALVAAAVGFAPTLPWAPLAALAVVAMAPLLVFMGSRTELTEAAPAAMHTTAGALYCGALLGFISLIYTTTSDGTGWVLALLFGTFFGDTAAYAFGRMFGKRKLAPRLSPGKTWAGAFGGVVGTILALTLVKLFFLAELAWLEIPLLAVPLSVACQLGDLAESFLKRCFGAKDSGRLIPGHGGLLDRVDALMFGAPVVYLFTLLRTFL